MGATWASIEQRYWRHVVAGPGCWGWDSSTSHGYGRLSGRGGVVLAHRLSWEIHHGPIPEGKCVLHHCDNRACSRPDHLFLGTKLDNIRDARDKGRSRRKVCRAGLHVLSGDNVLTFPSKPSARYCLACKKRAMREAALKERSERWARRPSLAEAHRLRS